MVIAVDFDGTIVQNQWPDIGPFRFWRNPCCAGCAGGMM